MKITAHVPVQQYGFVEIEGEPSDAKEIERLYNYYAETPVKFKSGNRVELKAFVGGSVFYDAEAHVYTNEAGEIYLSGSQYADTFRKPFDKVAISNLMANKVEGVNAEDIVKMWELKSQVSMDFGNSIHKALQLYEQYKGLAELLNKETHQHDHPIIKQAVDSFLELHKGETALSEVMVVDNTAKHAGQIDRLVILDKNIKICRVEDFKTNAEMKPADLEVYWKQLDFYGQILQAGGWKVEKPRIHHYNGVWKEYQK